MGIITNFFKHVEKTITEGRIKHYTAEMENEAKRVNSKNKKIMDDNEEQLRLWLDGKLSKNDTKNLSDKMKFEKYSFSKPNVKSNKKK
jgi:hypothetical protein